MCTIMYGSPNQKTMKNMPNFNFPKYQSDRFSDCYSDLEAWNTLCIQSFAIPFQEVISPNSITLW